MAGIFTIRIWQHYLPPSQAQGCDHQQRIAGTDTLRTICCSHNAALHWTNQRKRRTDGLQHNSNWDQRWPESLFKTPTPLLFQNFWIRVRKFFKFENPTPVQTPATIINPTEIHICFYLRNDHTDSCYCRNWKVTPAASGFSQILDSGCERKTQNHPGVDSRTQDPETPLIEITHMTIFILLELLRFQRYMRRNPVATWA